MTFATIALKTSPGCNALSCAAEVAVGLAEACAAIDVIAIQLLRPSGSIGRALIPY
jgi:hypothetical protein